jgi:hypothetical protein
VVIKFFPHELDLFLGPQELVLGHLNLLLAHQDLGPLQILVMGPVLLDEGDLIVKLATQAMVVLV